MYLVKLSIVLLIFLYFKDSSACNGNANFLFDKLIEYAKKDMQDTIDLKDHVKEYFQERKDGIQLALLLHGLKNFRRPLGDSGNTCFTLNGKKVNALARIEIFDIKGKGFVDFKRKIGEFRRKRSLVREKRWWNNFVKAIEKAGDDIAAEVKRTPGNLKDIGDKIAAEVKRTPGNLKDIGDKIAAEVKRIPDNIGDLIKSIRVDASVDFEVVLENMRLRVGIEGDLETKKLRMTDYEVEEVKGFNLWFTRLGGLAYAIEPIKSIVNANIPKGRIVDLGKDHLKKALEKAINDYTFDSIPVLN